MAKHFKPHGYQTIAVKHITETPRCALWAGMGLGKTVSTLTAINNLIQCGEDHPTIILAPLRVARGTWPDESEKWAHLSDIIVSPIVGGEAARLNALRKDASVYTINYENLVWLIELLGDRWPYRTVVADESTKLKSCRMSAQVSKNGVEFLRGQGGKRAAALAHVAHKYVKRWINLTGTPAAQGLEDLWGQTWYLDKGARLGNSFTAFRKRWFSQGFDGYSYEAVPHAQAEIQERLSDICLTILAEDWFDLEKPIVRHVAVDLPLRARALYKDMEKRMYLELESGHAVEAFNAASKTIKCLQLASGAIYVDPLVADDDHPKAKEFKEVHDAKLQALESIISEAGGMPVLVAYHFKSDLARIKKAFPKAREMKTKKDEDDWNAGKIPIVLIHPKSAGHGLNLQDGGNIIVFFSHWWSNEEYLQAIERIGPTRQMQSGHKRPVFIYLIVARDTVDEKVLLSRETNQSVQQILMKATSRR